MAGSLDDEALTEGANHLGYCLLGRDSNYVTFSVKGQAVTYSVLGERPCRAAEGGYPVPQSDRRAIPVYGKKIGTAEL